jgi:SAM-dependent methyltransferase
VTELTATLLDRHECPACGGVRAAQLVRQSYDAYDLRSFLLAYYGLDAGALDLLSRADYCLLRCHDCGLVYQRLAPIGDLAVKLYSEWIDPALAERESSDERSVGSHARLTEEIGTALQELRLPPDRAIVLDVGMGWGEWCQVARAYGCRVYGLELAAECLTNARALAIETVDWESLGAHRFDFINAAQVLEHLPSPAEALVALCDALKPGGMMRIAVPDGSKVDAVLSRLDWDLGGIKDRRFMLIHPLEHVNCFHSRSLDALAARAGLIPVQPSLANETVVIEKLRLRPFLTALARPLYRRLRPDPPARWYRKPGPGDGPAASLLSRRTC